MLRRGGGNDVLIIVLAISQANDNYTQGLHLQFTRIFSRN